MHIEPRKALNKAFLKMKPNRSGIDFMVYELYGLSEEEIKIVEES